MVLMPLMSWGLYTIANIRVRHAEQLLLSDDESTLVLVSTLGYRDGLKEHRVEVLNADSCEVRLTLLRRTNQQPRPKLAIAMSHDGSRLALVQGKEVLVYDTHRSWMQSPKQMILPHVLDQKHVAISPDGKSLIVAESVSPARIGVYDIESGQHSRHAFPPAVVDFRFQRRAPADIGNPRFRALETYSGPDDSENSSQSCVRLYELDGDNLLATDVKVDGGKSFLFGFSRNLKRALQYAPYPDQLSFQVVVPETNKVVWETDNHTKRIKWAGADKLLVETDNGFSLSAMAPPVKVYDTITGRWEADFNASVDSHTLWAYRSQIKTMLFARHYGAIRSVDATGSSRWLLTDQDRHPLWVTGIWVLVAVSWWLLFVWLTRGIRRSLRPLMQMIVLAAIVLTPIAIHYYMGPEPRRFRRVSEQPINGLLVAFCMLAAFWCVFGRIRWPSRMTIGLFLASLLLFVLSIRYTPQRDLALIEPMVVLPAIAVGILFFLSMRLAQIRLDYSIDSSETDEKSNASSLHIRDIGIWTFALALSFYFGRSIPFNQSWKSMSGDLITAATFAVVVGLIIWLIVGVYRLWIRIPLSLFAFAVVMAQLLFFPNRAWSHLFGFHTPDYGYAIGFVVLTCVALRMNHYRIERRRGHV